MNLEYMDQLINKLSSAKLAVHPCAKFNLLGTETFCRAFSLAF